MPKPSTDWNNVADWYDELLEGKSDTYQNKVILPNLLRILKIKPGHMILDLACGQGFFSRAFYTAGAKVIGVDLAKNLIAHARAHSPKEIIYHVAPADKLVFLKNASVDCATIVLALQNIKNLDGVMQECARVLKPDGRLVLILNHPAFRIPGASAWGWDEEHKIQFRRVDHYLSEATNKIVMHPGARLSEITISFHRPLQLYFKTLAKHNFAVHRLEEWNSHKHSQRGPRAAAEDRARKEIPLFLMMEAVKLP